MQSDGVIYLDYLLKQKGVRQGAGGGYSSKQKAAVVGYCFSGAMAMRIAAAMPEQVACALSFHGGWLVTDSPTSPHKLLSKIKARLYFAHAVNDPFMTAEQIQTLENALRAWHGAFESETYQGALHGLTLPGRAVYNEAQAERAFAKLLEALRPSLE